MLSSFRKAWRLLRRLSGDDAYEQYLTHYALKHSFTAEHEQHPLLTKAEFFKQWQDEKWNGIKRCC
ncbi:MAG: CstA-like transporter-associated (seleno)protein [Methylococcales bacterium]|jgi:uncharacterized short protein YbdD (DUF466 family)|nr:CstA-like transporter-associated (seleno)protein [Methylococcales bacterium]